MMIVTKLVSGDSIVKLFLYDEIKERRRWSKGVAAVWAHSSVERRGSERASERAKSDMWAQHTRGVLIQGDDQVTMATVACAWIRVLLLALKAVKMNNKVQKALLELERVGANVEVESDTAGTRPSTALGFRAPPGDARSISLPCS